MRKLFKSIKEKEEGGKEKMKFKYWFFNGLLSLFVTSLVLIVDSSPYSFNYGFYKIEGAFMMLICWILINQLKPFEMEK